MIQVTVGGPETITLSEKVVSLVQFSMLTPEDSNARSTDQYTQLIIEGKINPSIGGAENDATVALANWANVADHRADAYRPLKAKVIESGVVVREYDMPNAFVVDYDDDFSDAEGVGTFRLKVRQKKDKTKDFAVNGGYNG